MTLKEGNVVIRDSNLVWRTVEEGRRATYC